MQKSKLKLKNKKFLEILRKAEGGLALSQPKGFALITLLVFMVIGITVTTAAALVLTTNILAGSNVQNGLTAYYIAESGVEDASLRLLRNPLLADGTTYTLSSSGGSTNVTINSSVSGGTITNTITSRATMGTTTKTIRAITTYTSGQQTFTSWGEIQ